MQLINSDVYAGALCLFRTCVYAWFHFVNLTFPFTAVQFKNKILIIDHFHC